MKRALFALLVLATLALVVGVALGVREKKRREDEAKREEERRAKTLDRLTQLRDRVVAFGATTFEYPPSTAPVDSESDGLEALPAEVTADLVSEDGWGRSLHYRRPGPLHRDGWDVFSLGPPGSSFDPALALGESYTPPARDPAVDVLYVKETKERLAELHDLIVRLPKKPESTEVRDLVQALIAADLADRMIRARFLDAWGHRFHYACPGNVHAKGWDLYSLGANGDDEAGAGDDLVTGEDVR